RLHHPLHLRLVGAAVAAHRLLDTRRGVFDALDAGARRGDEDGSTRLPDEERDAGVGADVRLFQRDGIRRLPRDQLLDTVEDRAQPHLRPGPRRGVPPPVARGPEAPAVFVDESEPARCRPWIDAENLHDERLGAASDVPPAAERIEDVLRPQLAVAARDALAERLPRP